MCSWNLWFNHVRTKLFFLIVAAYCLSEGAVQAADGKPSAEGTRPQLHERKTAAGLPFVVLGEQGKLPKPVIVSLAMTGAETLQTEPYAASGRELVRNGWLAVSLDIPGHGRELRAGEPPGIDAWRVRIEKNEPFVDELARRVSAVLDSLISEHAIDPDRIAIEGTSRGGFLAAHVAAREPRIKAVMMYAPVTDLQYVREFQSVKDHPGLKALALSRVVDKLADRKTWLIIGNDDERVNTDSAIQFTRALAKQAKLWKIPAAVTLHVSATPGHSSHAAMHLEAVNWLRQQLPPSVNKP